MPRYLSYSIQRVPPRSLLNEGKISQILFSEGNFHKADRPDWSVYFRKVSWGPHSTESLLCVADDGSDPLWPAGMDFLYLTVRATPVTFCSIIPIK